MENVNKDENNDKAKLTENSGQENQKARKVIDKKYSSGYERRRRRRFRSVTRASMLYYFTCGLLGSKGRSNNARVIPVRSSSLPPENEPTQMSKQ